MKSHLNLILCQRNFVEFPLENLWCKSWIVFKTVHHRVMLQFDDRDAPVVCSQAGKQEHYSAVRLFTSNDLWDIDILIWLALLSRCQSYVDETWQWESEWFSCWCLWCNYNLKLLMLSKSARCVSKFGKEVCRNLSHLECIPSLSHLELPFFIFVFIFVCDLPFLSPKFIHSHIPPRFSFSIVAFIDVAIKLTMLHPRQPGRSCPGRQALGGVRCGQGPYKVPAPGPLANLAEGQGAKCHQSNSKTQRSQRGIAFWQVGHLEGLCSDNTQE